MADPILISKKEAKNLAIYSQGLANDFDNSLAIIKQLSYVQIDTISVAERAHNHVFYSRNPKFSKEGITKMMDDKSIFEYWSHAAAYLPMEDFRYSLFRKEQYKTGKHWFPRDKKVDKYVMDRIKSEGALQSKDFDYSEKSKGWYEWKPAKVALTNLFMDGSLMINNRKGFHKIFDLTERVIPANVNTKLPTIEEYCIHLINNAINAHGLVSLNEICYLRKGVKPIVKKLLQELLESDKLIKVRVENNSEIYYSLSKHQILKTNNKVNFLSPFDNLVIQRKRVKEIFDFDYQIECYVPEKKRKYGYYTLPILYGNEFVARINTKADRKTKIFTVKGIWFESNFEPSEMFYKKFFKELIAFSKFCGCLKIEIEKVYPSSYKKPLNLLIKDYR